MFGQRLPAGSSANELNTLKAEEPDVVEGIGCPTPKICSPIPGFPKRILPSEEKERITPELDHANRTRTVYHPPAIPTLTPPLIAGYQEI